METTRRPNIVVSGASKGIGRAIVKRFYEEGFDVAFCARDNKVLNQFKNELESLRDDQKVLAISCDMSDKEAVEWFAEQVAFEFESIDVLVNNAGIFLPGQITNEEEGVFEKVMHTNLFSAYYLTRSLLPYMHAQEHAHIFNMCSTASIMAYSNGGSYCISKYALLGMNNVLREELKDENIAVTAILPGATYTDSWKASELPEERFMDAGQVAEAVWMAYRMSPRSVMEEILIRPMKGDIK
ncbi:MAG: SDR family NAD(P)-dependent oxidoreductase [Bacteroidetes bacterium]|nr:SDR family NAD(P)-dependent oxidoreductase [Bacteroidota bacterium]